MIVERLLADAEATEALGAEIARVMRDHAGGVLYLSGPLGAGKTTLARGLLRALGVTGAVRSPTYTLLEPYETEAFEVIHLDLYRLTGPDDLHGLGLDDYPPEHCWWLVEWPERGVGALPSPTLTVSLRATAEGRSATVGGARAGQLDRTAAERYRRP